ncbi:MAG TPA: phage tail fiber protein, partial [Bacteroidia bacterium]|nr:phage tail fiber protein [Bacteroidia bacterium]
MSYTVINYVGDGVTTTYAINFPLGYINESDVTCRVNNEVDAFSNPSYRPLTFISQGLVTIGGTVPALGQTIVFQRTVSAIVLEHDYVDGAIDTAQNLNESFEQSLMLIQQLLDGLFPAPPPNPIPVTAAQTNYVTQTQLTAAQAITNAAIASLAAAQTAATAAAIAAVEADITSQIASTLAELNLKSGDRLLQSLYTSVNPTSHITATIPFSTTPTGSSGTVLLTQSITPTAVGNTITIQAIVPCIPYYGDAGVIIIVGGNYVIGDYMPSNSAKDTMMIQYDYTTVGTSPITITVNVGILSNAAGSAYLIINDGNGGGQHASMLIQEIGVTSAQVPQGDVSVTDNDAINATVYP